MLDQSVTTNLKATLIWNQQNILSLYQHTYYIFTTLYTSMVSKKNIFCGTCWTLWTHYQMAGHNVSPWGQPGNLVIKERALACAYLYTLYVEAKICMDSAIYFQRTLKYISINPVECWRWSMWKIIIAWRTMQPAFSS